MYVTGRGGSFRTSSSAGAAYRLQWIRHIRRAPCISMRRQLSARLHTRRSNAASPASWESLPWSVPSFQPVNNFGADLVSACNTVMQLVYICHAYAVLFAPVSTTVADQACVRRLHWHLWRKLPNGSVACSIACGNMGCRQCRLRQSCWEHFCAIYFELTSGVPLLRRSNSRMSAAYRCLRYQSPPRSLSPGHLPAAETVRPSRTLVSIDVYFIDIWKRPGNCIPELVASYECCCCQLPI